MNAARSAGEGTAADTIFFLSDYGRDDEFVGVVHAVLRRLAPGALVIDLTHEIPPFDVRAGAASLVRAVPHLGSGVVLGVVDPGVGSGRRGVAVEVGEEGRTLFFVGPDNGLFPAALEACPGPARAVLLAGSDPEVETPTTRSAATFDGRDLFAPAAAALCQGQPLDRLGPAVALDRLVRIPGPVWSEGRVGTWRALRAEVTWVDRFGNVQLAVPGAAAVAAIDGHRPDVEVERQGPVPDPDGSTRRFERVSLVRAFSDLERGELGLLVDANGHLAVVVCEGSAAEHLDVRAGGLVALVW